MKLLAEKLAAWYAKHARDLPWRRDVTPYRVWVSEIMLQQTQVATVLPYFERFMARFPDVRALARASEDEVLALWSGLGYYRRARMLHAAAKEVVRAHGGQLPHYRDALLGLPGIGRYTAGAIASIAFNQPEPVVDGNVERVFARLTRERREIKSGMVQKAVWQWASEIVRACAMPRVLNQALMELGATVCTPRNPRCESCPLARECAARKYGEQEALPRAAKAAKSRRVRYTAYLARDEKGRVLLVRRRKKTKSLLPHGIWELPHDIDTRGAERTPVVKHSIMNWRIEMAVVGAAVSPLLKSVESRWFSPRELSALPMASITRKALEAGASSHAYSAGSTR